MWQIYQSRWLLFFSLRKIPLCGEKIWKEGAGQIFSLPDTQLHSLERVFELLFSELSWRQCNWILMLQTDRRNKQGHVWDTRVLMLDLGAGNDFFKYARPAFLQWSLTSKLLTVNWNTGEELHGLGSSCCAVMGHILFQRAAWVRWVSLTWWGRTPQSQRKSQLQAIIFMKLNTKNLTASPWLLYCNFF